MLLGVGFSYNFSDCNYFEELQTKLFKVELILDTAILRYIRKNTIKIWLTPNYLLIDRQLLCSSNITLTIAMNLTVL